MSARLTNWSWLVASAWLTGCGPTEDVDVANTQAGVLPATEGPAVAYVDATPAEREQAWQEIRKIQRKTGRALKKHGISEEDVVKEILKDD